MLLIPCPWCGPRDEIEFRYGGPAHLQRPEPHDQVSDEHWGQYLFFRDNPRGAHNERWVHAFGCRRWFNLTRDTTDHRNLAVYAMGAPRPEFAQDTGDEAGS